MKYRVVVMPEARASIDACIDYIANERQAPESATRFLERVYRAIAALETFPEGAPLAPEDAYRTYEIRVRIVGEWLVLFNINEPTSRVRVIGFRHGRQRPLNRELPANPG
ncbi:MAG: type II toxin-antitoxin system RelE/ParE family toxin [Planctomycetota bacterium]